jgi:hypothetical protein
MSLDLVLDKVLSTLEEAKLQCFALLCAVAPVYMQSKTRKKKKEKKAGLSGIFGIFRMEFSFFFLTIQIPS